MRRRGALQEEVNVDFRMVSRRSGQMEAESATSVSLQGKDGKVPVGCCKIVKVYLVVDGNGKEAVPWLVHFYLLLDAG